MSKTARALSADHNKEIVMREADETTCGVCYAEFLDVEDLKVHIEQIHPSGNLINCHFCDQKLTDAENYALHMRDIHLLDFKACWACTRVFTDSSQFRKHEIKHPTRMREGTFICSQCDEFVLNKYDLRQHEKANHNTSEGAFLDKYYALLTSVINIKAETLIQSSGKDLVFTCCACTLSTMDLEVYVAHLKKNNCRSYVCDWCSGLCRRKSDLVFHIKQHMKGKADDQIVPSKINMKQCLKCKEYYHKSVVNHRCSNLKCSHCDMVFKTMYELSEHQPKAHPLSVALSVCKFCRKECIGGDSLDKHMQRAHNHELHLYKYTCSYCDTTFKHPQRLFAHYFLKHKEISPYLCKICDKSFRIRKSFTLHIKLQHKSEGYVEFDEKLHVFFTDKKSEKPFQPVSKYASEIPVEPGPSKGKPAEQNKAKKSKDLKVANIDSADPTDNESKDTNTKKTRKRKKDDINEVMVLSDYDSDDEPLVVVKKKAKLKSLLKKRPLLYKGKPTKKISKNQLTCKICKKYCYTFQNYQNHVNLHFRDEAKKCIKCSLLFKSKDDLQKHMTDQHSSSQLTETLKNIIERRKKGDHKQEMSTTMKFLKTIKKVQIEKGEVTATLSPITKEISVQKFIENFTPEGGPTKTIDIKNSITIMKVTQPVEKEPLIKMTKFKPPAPIKEGTIKLAMPVKFRRCNEQHSVSVRRVQTDVVESKLNFTYDDGNQFQDEYNDNDDNDNDYSYQEEAKESVIPEVEQEVTLGTDESPKKTSATHKIVIPKLPKELKSIRIAHLLPEAPYYKIVKVADIIKDQEEKSKQPKPEPVENEPVDTDIRLPDGTKLVHVNPLAHLLGNTSVEKIVKTTNKYYKAKPRNFEAVLAKALRKLEEAPKKQKKKTVKTENKEASPDKGTAVVDLSEADAEKETVVNDETHTEFTEETIEELTENDP